MQPLTDPALLTRLLAFLLLAVVAAVAVAEHTAVDRASRPRLRLLEDGGVRRATLVLAMLDEASQAPTTLLVLTALGIGGAGAALIWAALAETLAWPVGAVAVIVVGLIVLLAALAVGRAIGTIRPEQTALALAPGLRWLGILLTPVVGPMYLVERRALRFASAGENGHDHEENLRLLVETVEDTRSLEEDERDMIQGIFIMGERPAREVMVPRIDITALPKEATIGQVLDRVVETGYSRIPIYQDDIDEIVGVVYAKDILGHLRSGALDDPAAPIARRPYFVPDTKKVDELLQDLQKQRVHMAIVVDEYGGTAGLLTIEDLLEEIVGEIRDEYDLNEEAPIQQIDERESVVDARVPIRDVNEALDLHLDDEEFDTLGGLVYHQLGKVPVDGDEVRVNGCVVTVVETEGRRIRKLRVTILDESVHSTV